MSFVLLYLVQTLEEEVHIIQNCMTWLVMMIYILFSILFFSLASAECPPGYVDGGTESSYCYMISPAKLTWAAAQEVRFNKILII